MGSSVFTAGTRTTTGAPGWTTNGVNFFYQHFYPKCLADTDLNTEEMIKVEKNKTLDIFECGAHCKYQWPHMYFLMKVRGEGIYSEKILGGYFTSFIEFLGAWISLQH